MIARKSVFIIGLHLISGVLGYIGLKFIALYMTPYEYGIIGFAFGLVALFSFFGNLGFNSVIIRLFPYFRDDQGKHQPPHAFTVEMT